MSYVVCVFDRPLTQTCKWDSPMQCLTGTWLRTNSVGGTYFRVIITLWWLNSRSYLSKVQQYQYNFKCSRLQGAHEKECLVKKVTREIMMAAAKEPVHWISVTLATKALEGFKKVNILLDCQNSHTGANTEEVRFALLHLEDFSWNIQSLLGRQTKSSPFSNGMSYLEHILSMKE